MKINVKLFISNYYYCFFFLPFWPDRMLFSFPWEGETFCELFFVDTKFILFFLKVRKHEIKCGPPLAEFIFRDGLYFHSINIYLLIPCQ